MCPPLLVAAVSGTVSMLLAQYWVRDLSIEEDQHPRTISGFWSCATGTGRMVVTIEYLIEPTRQMIFLNHADEPPTAPRAWNGICCGREPAGAL
jgi:hypothetical protein